MIELTILTRFVTLAVLLLPSLRGCGSRSVSHEVGTGIEPPGRFLSQNTRNRSFRSSDIRGKNAGRTGDRPAEFRRESHGTCCAVSQHAPGLLTRRNTAGVAQSFVGYCCRVIISGCMRLRFPVSAALFAILLGDSVYAQFGVFAPGRIYIAHAATGQEPVSPESGLAPGSIADVNLMGIEENLGQGLLRYAAHQDGRRG